MSDRLAGLLADLYVWSHPFRARAVDRGLRRVWTESGRHGPPPRARDTHRAFAMAVRDFLAGDVRGGNAPRVRLDGEARSILRAALEAKRSTVVVSGHFGPWEVALQWLAREIGPVHALARRHRFSAVERFFAARRAAFGVRTLSARRPAAAALERLRAGGWIAALADRAALRRADSDRGGRAIRSGGLVEVDRAPLLIARRAAAQVLAGVAWRARDGVAEVRFHPPFTLGPRRGDISLAQAEERLQTFFDDHVRAHPTQWFEWDRGILAGPAAGGSGSTSR
jgi:lauroyl/myristoyl acyltransferase